MFKSNLFLFLGLLVSCDKNNKNEGKEKFTIEKWPQIFDRTERWGLMNPPKIVEIFMFLEFLEAT